MFDIGWSELVVIGVVALIAIGPKELPGVLRMVGQWMGKARRMAGEFQSQFQEAMREAELADVKKQFDDVSTGGFEHRQRQCAHLRRQGRRGCAEARHVGHRDADAARAADRRDAHRSNRS